jgi:hypothetical protein
MLTQHINNKELNWIELNYETLQSFVGPWLLFQFLDCIHRRYDALDEGSARRKASTYTQNNTNTE